MKEFLYKVKTRILFCVIIFMMLFIVSHFFLKLFDIQFRQWVYCFIWLVLTIGFIIGVMQEIRRKSKTIKALFLMVVLVIVIFVTIFWQIILFCFATLYKSEKIVYKDGTKYVAYVHSFFQVDVYYYDYINIFLVGNQIKIYEYYGEGGYNPFDESHSDYEPLQYEYYDNK